MSETTESEDAQSAVAESERRYRELFDEAPVSIWEEDCSEVKTLLDRLRAEGVTDFGRHFEENPELLAECLSKIRVTNVNQATLDMFRSVTRYPFLEGIGSVFADSTATAFRNEMVAFAGGVTRVEEEVELRRSDGELFQALVRVTIPEAYREDWSRVLVSIIDITERKKAEESLTESEEKYRLLADNVSDNIWTADMQLNWKYTSPAVEKITGYTPEEVVKIPVHETLTPESLELALKAFAEELELDAAGAEPDRERTFEFEQYHKDGSTIWTEVSMKFLRDEDDKPIGILGVTRDATERKEAEEELLEQKLFIESSLDSMADALVVYDLVGKPLRWNRAFREITGYCDEEIQAMMAWDFHPAEDIAFVAESFGGVVESGGQMFIETNILSKDGMSIPCALSGSLMRNRNGEPVALCGVGRDISDRKKIEAELLEHRDNLQGLVSKRTQELEEVNTQLRREIAERKLAEQELRRVNEELEDYAKLVSHEIRTPLSGILLALEYLERLAGTLSPAGLDQEMSAIVEQAKDTVSSAESNVESLLRLAKAGQVPEDIEDVDVGTVVRDVLKGAGEETYTNGVAFEIDDDLGAVRADPLHVQMVFSNLLNNALKYCDSAEPLIEVRKLDGSRADGNRYLVRDNGSGLPAGFEGDFTESSLPRKSGLGMAIVGKIVKVYGGSARAYNDSGACIEFVLRDYQHQSPRSVS